MEIDNQSKGKKPAVIYMGDPWDYHDAEHTRYVRAEQLEETPSNLDRLFWAIQPDRLAMWLNGKWTRHNIVANRRHHVFFSKLRDKSNWATNRELKTSAFDDSRIRGAAKDRNSFGINSNTYSTLFYPIGVTTDKFNGPLAVIWNAEANKLAIQNCNTSYSYDWGLRIMDECYLLWNLLPSETPPGVPNLRAIGTDNAATEWAVKHCGITSMYTNLEMKDFILQLPETIVSGGRPAIQIYRDTICFNEATFLDDWVARGRAKYFNPRALNKDPSTLYFLPLPVLLNHIFPHFNPTELLQLRLVCKWWNLVIHSDELWESEFWSRHVAMDYRTEAVGDHFTAYNSKCTSICKVACKERMVIEVQKPLLKDIEQAVREFGDTDDLAKKLSEVKKSVFMNTGLKPGVDWVNEYPVLELLVSDLTLRITKGPRLYDLGNILANIHRWRNYCLAQLRPCAGVDSRSHICPQAGSYSNCVRPSHRESITIRTISEKDIYPMESNYLRQIVRRNAYADIHDEDLIHTPLLRREEEKERRNKELYGYVHCGCTDEIGRFGHGYSIDESRIFVGEQLPEEESDTGLPPQKRRRVCILQPDKRISYFAERNPVPAGQTCLNCMKDFGCHKHTTRACDGHGPSLTTIDRATYNTDYKECASEKPYCWENYSDSDGLNDSDDSESEEEQQDEGEEPDTPPIHFSKAWDSESEEDADNEFPGL